MYHHVKIVGKWEGKLALGQRWARSSQSPIECKVGIWDKNEKQGKKNAFSPKPLQSLAQAGRTHRNPVNTFCIKFKTLALQEWLYPSHGKPTKQKRQSKHPFHDVYFLMMLAEAPINPGRWHEIMGPWSMWQNIWYQANPRQITAVTADVPSN